MVLSKLYLPTGLVLGAVVVAVVLGAGTSSSSAIRLVPVEPAAVQTAAEKAFDDAPYGVDSMVTGPTSAAFKQRQDRLNCAASVWPNVPVDCFPG